ncbi:hypothetical protein ACFXPI_27115 [Streptomyces sp. NPDC059104]|uniref:hypothetical protein n=1 Tax=Streptomyces sp. NPDC059104 TaxID=3346729 RepID=UPI0036C4D808
MAENLGSLVSHTRVGLACKVDNGKEVDREGVTSRTWYKLDTSRTDGKPEVPGWISGAYTKVGGPSEVPQCPSAAAQQKVPAGAGLGDAVGG